MRSRIPMVSNGNEVFKDVMDYFETIRNRKAQEPLRKAQTEEAQAKATKARMFANLINQALGGGALGGEEENEGDQQQSQQSFNGQQQPQAQGSGVMMPEKNPPAGFMPMNPLPQENPNIDAIGGGNAPEQQQVQGQQPPQNDKVRRAKEMLYGLGMLKETPSEQAAREEGSAWKKGLGAADAKQLEKWDDKITASYEMMPVLENIQDIISNPKVQEVYQHPEYMNYDVKFAKRFNKDPEVQQLLTSLATNTKSVFSTMGQDFKGAFREFEFKLFNAAAPNENDSLNQLIAKNNTMMMLKDLAIQRYTLANNIVRGSKGTISPANALKIANQQINTKDVRDKVQSQYKALEIAKKSKKTPKITTTTSNGENSITSSVTPEGKVHMKNLQTGAEGYIPENRIDAYEANGYAKV